MLKKLKIKNYRSIKEVEIKFGKINAFIGPNNAGKSNIMKALDLILGPTYPTTKSFSEEDFYNYDKSNPIEIEVYFDPLLSPKDIKNIKIGGFKLIFDGKETDYICIDSDGNPINYPSSDRHIKVYSDLREKVTVMYISLDRLASQQLRPTQWTLYGKILRKLYEEIPQDNRKSFEKQVGEAFEDKIFTHIRDFENILRNHVKSQIGTNLKIKLSLVDPLHTIKSLRPYFIEDGREFDAENMGAGTQSALAVAIAKAYTKIVQEAVILIIEEPELFLHPHGCRHFYKLLKELSNEGVQVIYTTHERSFIDIGDYKNIHLVKKENNETKVYSGHSLEESSNLDEVKLSSKFNEYINEVFFADFVILVEGFSDKIACKLALEKLGVELDLHNISIIDCGSKTAIKPIAEILKAFKIKTAALLDEDAEKEIKELKHLLGEEFIFIQEPDLEGMLGREKLGLQNNQKLTKEMALEKLPPYFAQYDVSEMYKKLKDIIPDREKAGAKSTSREESP